MEERVTLTFDRITTPRFTGDVDELRAWTTDIRQVLTANALMLVTVNPKVSGWAGRQDGRREGSGGGSGGRSGC